MTRPGGKSGARRSAGGGKGGAGKPARRKTTSRRTVVPLLLLGFVLVATGVIARRTYGIAQARQLRDMERRRQALEVERVRLEASIRAASSRARLAPVAEHRLNMHLPTPDQVIILSRSTPRGVDSVGRRPASVPARPAPPEEQP